MENIIVGAFQFHQRLSILKQKQLLVGTLVPKKLYIDSLPNYSQPTSISKTSSWPKYTHLAASSTFPPRLPRRSPVKRHTAKAFATSQRIGSWRTRCHHAAKAVTGVTALAVVWQVRIRDTEFKVRCADGFGPLEVEDVWNMCVSAEMARLICILWMSELWTFRFRLKI